MNQAQKTVYEVEADAESGEWRRSPEATEETASFAEFLTRDDSASIFHTTYESPFDGSTRLLRVILVA